MPHVKKQKNIILNLLDLDFIKQKKDIIFIGNPGVGKSMLAKNYSLCCHTSWNQDIVHIGHGYDQPAK